MTNKERTSALAASRAGKVLRDARSTVQARSAAGSALAQRAPHIEETSRAAASAASRVLRDPKSSAAAQSAAASALTQRPNKRGR